jgi:hypothetical protein
MYWHMDWGQRCLSAETHASVDADQGAGQRVRQELLLDLDGLADDPVDLGLRAAVLEVLVEQAGKVGVHALVARDELVREGQAAHEAALLEPEDGREGPREEDALHTRKRDEARAEWHLGRDVLERPVGLLPDARDYGQINPNRHSVTHSSPCP